MKKLFTLFLFLSMAFRVFAIDLIMETKTEYETPIFNLNDLNFNVQYLSKGYIFSDYDLFKPSEMSSSNSFFSFNTGRTVIGVLVTIGIICLCAALWQGLTR